ncbi:hypothetical protein KC318_g4120, partial [Hortaea werneckii]
MLSNSVLFSALLGLTAAAPSDRFAPDSYVTIEPIESGPFASLNVGFKEGCDYLVAGKDLNSIKYWMAAGDFDKGARPGLHDDEHAYYVKGFGSEIYRAPLGEQPKLQWKFVSGPGYQPTYNVFIGENDSNQRFIPANMWACPLNDSGDNYAILMDDIVNKGREGCVWVHPRSHDDKPKGNASVQSDSQCSLPGWKPSTHPKGDFSDSLPQGKFTIDLGSGSIGVINDINLSKSVESTA